MECSIEGCTRKRKYVKTGWCQTHYHRYWRHGDPMFVVAPRWAKGGKSHKWTGDAAGYRAVHWRVRNERGEATTHDCIECGAVAEQWAYDNSDVDESTEIVNGSTCYFSLKTDHYQPMCRSCHRKFDAARRRTNG